MNGTVSTPPFASRKAFTLHFGAWDPMGSPPGGIPADTINLAAINTDITSFDSVDVTTDGALFEVAWVEQTAEQQFGVSVPGDVTVNIAIGNPSDPSAANSAQWIGIYVAAGAYANPIPVTTIRVTIGVTAGLLSDLTMGFATLHVGVGRWPSTIRRAS